MTDKREFKKPPIDRLLDAQLHLKMAREGTLSKADERIERAERELRVFTK